MAFIRVKRIRGKDYAYLVESTWDTERKTSKQSVVKYLGSPDRLRLEDIPATYRDKKVESFMLQRSAGSEERRARTVSRFKDDLFEALMAGDKRKAAEISEEARVSLGLDGLYVGVVTEAMHEVGEKWHAGEISISVEHLASNIMAQIVETMNTGIRKKGAWRGTAVICTPQGEEHVLASKILEGLLTARGYRSLNISTSAPTDSIAAFISSKKPDRVLVSLTIPEFLPSAIRLVRAVNEAAPATKVVVGGQGIREGMEGKFPPGTVVAQGTTLEDLEDL